MILHHNDVIQESYKYRWLSRKAKAVGRWGPLFVFGGSGNTVVVFVIVSDKYRVRARHRTEQTVCTLVTLPRFLLSWVNLHVLTIIKTSKCGGGRAVFSGHSSRLKDP
jgi:hypothetical protein